MLEPCTRLDAQRQAIWERFRSGVLDEDAATAALLAVDLMARHDDPLGANHVDAATASNPEHARAREVVFQDAA